MKKNKGYTSKPLSFTRRMVIASVAANKKNAIHCVTEVNITEARKNIKADFEKTGDRISLTGFIVKSFGNAIGEFPEMNSFIRGRKLIILEDVNISVLVEREIDGQKVPEPLGIKKVQDKSLKEITAEIRAAQANTGNELGNLTGSQWINLIPPFLIRTFIRIADRNIKMAKRYGKIAVTAVGMYAENASWFIPHGTATVLLTIGSIRKEGEKEFLCITASFDHEIIDGSPAARFMSKLAEELKAGKIE